MRRREAWRAAVDVCLGGTAWIGRGRIGDVVVRVLASAWRRWRVAGAAALVVLRASRCGQRPAVVIRGARGGGRRAVLLDLGHRVMIVDRAILEVGERVGAFDRVHAVAVSVA